MPQPDSAFTPGRTVALALVPALAVALPLRLYGLAAKPLWLDEAITHERALLPPAELLANSFAHKHFPTYFLIARYFDATLIDEWMLRLPSVLFGCLAVLLVALIATEVHSRRAGLVAGLLMAVSPAEVQFGQEARPYALLSCAVLLALWGLLRVVKDATTAEPTVHARRAGWIAYTAGTIAALNILLVSVVWWLASALAGAFILGRAKQPRLMRHWLIAQAIILLAWLPGLTALVLAHRGGALEGSSWIPATTWQHVWSVLSAVYLFRLSDVTTLELLPMVVPGLGFVVLAFALFGAWQLRSAARLLAVLAVACMVMPAVMAIVSLFHPFWVPRYLLWSTGALFVLAGIGIASLPRRAFAPATAVLVVAGVANLVPYYAVETKPRWDLAAAYLSANAQADDAIIANSGAATYMLGAYGDRYRLNHEVVYGADVAGVVARLPPRGRIWVAFGRTGQALPVSEDAYRERWSVLGAPVVTRRFGRHVVLMRFDRG